MTTPYPKRIDAGPGLELHETDIGPAIDFEQLAEDRHQRAITRSLEDSSNFPRLGLPSLHNLAGAMAPGELWVIGGRQGNGKSLFVHNLAMWLLRQLIPTVVLGTEQSDDVLAIKQACVMAKVPARRILKPEPEDAATTEWKLQYEAMAKELTLLHSMPYTTLLSWATDEYIDRGSLTRWTQQGIDALGAKVVIVDHLHHMRHGEGKNDVHELTETVHLAKSLAKRYGITLVCASQIKRTAGDAMKAYSPPTAEDFAGASAIERTADVMLGLWRPLRDDLPMDKLKEMKEKAKYGHDAEDKVYRPNVMGVRLVKDRLGDAPGTQTLLTVNKGHLEEMSDVTKAQAEKDKYTTDSQTKGRRP